VSLPCGFDSAGLPIGIQLVGKCGSDHLLLRTAAALESALWIQNKPQLAKNE
jgi:Asp-tRNA(Asn)/Glu-tRNA(Gln) amidotransferase A subunit family amidase